MCLWFVLRRVVWLTRTCLGGIGIGGWAQAVKQYGLNYVRLHQKANPPRWYTYIETEGIALQQDMIQKYGGATAATVAPFITELKALVTGPRYGCCTHYTQPDTQHSTGLHAHPTRCPCVFVRAGTTPLPSSCGQCSTSTTALRNSTPLLW